MTRSVVTKLSRFLLLLALAIVWAACDLPAPGAAIGEDTPVTAAPETAVPATPSVSGVEPRRGGTLVIAATTDPGHLNPAIATSGPLHFVAGSLYNGLVALDEDFQPVPDLAESWTVEDDGRTYTFRLHSGVRWHDGQPLTSADVKFTFEELLLKYHARTRTGLEPVLEAIDTPDETTVVFRFNAPYAPLLQQLNVIEAPILPKHVYEGTDPQTNPANLDPVGTGPFRFVSYSKDQHVTLERNPDYFKADLPYLDRVVFTIIPEATTRVLAFEQRQVDYLSVPGADVERLQSMAGVTVGRSPAGSGGSFCVQTVILNLENDILEEQAVRQALNLAVDRERMLQQILIGQGRVARGPMASTLWAFASALDAFDYDPQEAGLLLDQAGLTPGSDGVRFALTAVMPNTVSKLAEILRENLEEIGVRLELDLRDFNEANQTVFIRREFDLGYASYCNGPDPEIGVRRAFDSANIREVLFSNGAAYRSAEVDELFARAAAEVDREARIAIYAEVQQMLVQDLPYLWLLESEGAYAHRSSVHDLRPWTSSLAEYAWIEAGP